MHATAVVQRNLLEFKLTPALAHMQRENRGRIVPAQRAVRFVGAKQRSSRGSVLAAAILLSVSLLAGAAAPPASEPAETIGGGLFLAGQHLYVAAWGYGVQVLDISNPTRPKWAGAWNHRGAPTGVFVVGDHAYVANRPCGLEVLDVRNPGNPTSFANLRTGGDAMGVFVKGDFAYLADGVISGGSSHLPESEQGLKLIHIRNPAEPKLLGQYQGPNGNYGVPVSGEIAFVAKLDRIVYEDRAPNSAIPTWRMGRSIVGLGLTGFVLRSNLLFSTTGRSGLRIFDVTAASQPKPVADFKTDYSTWDVRVAGQHAYLMDAGASIHVLDVSAPDNPREVGLFHCTGYVSRWLALQPPVTPKRDELPASSVPAPDAITPIETAPPELHQPRRLADGSFAFTLVGVPGATYVIQMTSDWLSWSNLSTNALPAAGHAVVVDMGAAEVVNRFYRAVRQ